MMNNSESNKQVAGSHTPGPWSVGVSGDNGLPCVDGIDPKDGSLFEICEVWGEENDLEITEMSTANARRIVACVNACDGISTEYLETTGLPEFAGKTLCADIAKDELDKVEQQRDQLATKVADLELALFAENQKRQDVERERDQLLEFLCELVDIEGPQPGTAAWADKARTIIAAANLGDRVQVPAELVGGAAE